MERKILPKELISLIHHLKLNEGGWWDNGIKKLIEAVFWIENKNLSFVSIADSLYDNFKLEIETNRLRYLIQDLIHNEVLLELEGDLFKMSEECLTNFKASLIESENIEENAKSSFIKVLGDFCSSLKNDSENAWVNFNNNLLTPLVKSLGAKTYELISGKIQQEISHPYYIEFVKIYPTEIQNDLRKAISEFLSPFNDSARIYVLGLLNTYFFIEAGNLSEEAIIGLNKLKNKLITFEVFVDSNFLFSILDLHDNPSNEAAQSLLKLIENLKEKISVRLYVSPPTVLEMQKVLTNQETSLNTIRIISNIILVANESNINGFKRKYFEILMKSNYKITPADYFNPYINHLVPVLRDKGVELYNDKKFEDYSTKQEVVDDLLSQLEFENLKQQNSGNGYNPKEYEQLQHDMVLWHFVNDKRSKIVDSAEAAKYWIVTIDFRFLGFDAYKRHSSNYKTPVCIHPTTFIQLLQFWTPRSLEFEKAMIGNLRLPLLFGNYDSKAEKITLNILSSISRFEDAEDLSIDTISSILYDDAVRAKIKGTKEIDQNIEIIKNVIIEKFNKSVEEKEILKKNILEKVTLIEQSQKLSNELEDKLSKSSKEKEYKDREIKKFKERLETLENERKEEKNFEKNILEYERKTNEYVSSKWIEYSTQKNYFLLFILLIMVLIGIIIISILYIDEAILKYSLPIVYFIFSLIFSFCNKAKIINSFHLMFRSKQIYKEKKKEFIIEYAILNKPPEKKL